LEFEWHEKKRQEVISEHGVDMLYAGLIFEDEVLTRIDDRKDYGEVRLISLGMVGDECLVVVHTERNGRIRLITAWKGGRDERAQYQESIARRHQTDEAEG
jgi:uncharacterized DUF497 family protein